MCSCLSLWSWLPRALYQPCLRTRYGLLLVLASGQRESEVQGPLSCGNNTVACPFIPQHGDTRHGSPHDYNEQAPEAGPFTQQLDRTTQTVSPSPMHQDSGSRAFQGIPSGPNSSSPIAPTTLPNTTKRKARKHTLSTWGLRMLPKELQMQTDLSMESEKNVTYQTCHKIPVVHRYPRRTSLKMLKLQPLWKQMC